MVRRRRRLPPATLASPPSAVTIPATTAQLPRFRNAFALPPAAATAYLTRVGPAGMVHIPRLQHTGSPRAGSLAVLLYTASL